MPAKGTKAFVDPSDRAWVLYDASENIFLIDTNGDKGPNHFGKDRWGFTFAEKTGKEYAQLIPVKTRVCLIKL